MLAPAYIQMMRARCLWPQIRLTHHLYKKSLCTTGLISALFVSLQALPDDVLARHAPPTSAELLAMAESLGLEWDEDLLRDIIDGVDGDLQQVATMLTDQGAPSLLTLRAQAQEAAAAAAGSVRLSSLVD
jgi:hypothetical protein